MVVTAVAPGTATITATAGDASASAEGTVRQPPSPDREALAAFYDATGGTGWTNQENWLSSRPVGEWYGVDVNGEGRVTALHMDSNNLVGSLPPETGRMPALERIFLPFNGLSGGIPRELGELSRLRLLRLDSNNLTGPIPRELGSLGSLEELQLSQNNLEGPIPGELGNLTSLESLALGVNNYRSPIPPELGKLANLRVLSIRSAGVTGEIPPELGALASLEVLNLPFNRLRGPIPAEIVTGLTNLRSISLSSNQLSGPIPPELGNLAKLNTLDLGYNQLGGPIPPELGNLSALEWLRLEGNDLTGIIPPSLGRLSRLARLDLARTGLTGPIPREFGGLASLEMLYVHETGVTGTLPAELGQLASLEELHLYGNAITGPIPSEWGDFASLRAALLQGNRLSGSLPPELGNLGTLTHLWLRDNDLQGGIPARFGDLGDLRELDLGGNPGMSGSLPAELTRLGALEALHTTGTELCAPDDQDFQTWLSRVWKRRVATCRRVEDSIFYLTQAVQSRAFPVPLVAGKPALLRVFVTAEDPGDATLPPVRARFYVDGNAIHVAHIPGQAAVIPSEVTEGDLAKTANAEVPGHVLRPGTEIVIEVDPDGTLDPALGLTRRIPETGRHKLDVRAMPVLDLTLVPFLWTAAPDSSILETTAAMAADPMEHDLFRDTRVLTPVADLATDVHEAVVITSNSAFGILAATEMIRVLEGGGHYMGLMAGPVTGASGVAKTPGRASFAQPKSDVIAHELGHNMGLQHAPCGNPGAPDPAFPNKDGSVGAWGYDFATGTLVPPTTAELMSYCFPRWISDYSFTNALNFRLIDEDPASAARAASREALLLWGGTDSDGVPFLEPAFATRATPSRPEAGGDHTLTGFDAQGRRLFFVSFTMGSTADSDGRSTFAFTLPAEPAWGHSLARITLSGPGGLATLDMDTNRPVVILRNPQTGQVRGILRGTDGSGRDIGDMADPAATARLLPPALSSGYEVMLSRGIPAAGSRR